MSIGILKKSREIVFLCCYPKQFFSEIKKSAKAGTAPVFVSELAFFNGLSTKSAVHLLF
ncbi:hypothetical protein [Enterococcus gallinarum]|uniref:hypothetical protein n=1 Tax=Enterococcus gallinarum TaxID=1353 RepID=UPI0028934F77|nr:hypothetical protein [Enterococcus gallinarum]